MDKTKIVFWNVDTQEDLVSEDGKLKVPNIEGVKSNLKKLTDFAKDSNIKVVNSMNWFTTDTKFLSESPDYIETFPSHCIMNTNGTRFIAETSPERGDTMVIDWEPSKGMNFHDIHRHRNIIIRKNSLDVFEGNSFTEAVVNNLGIPFLDRPTFIVYGLANIKPTVDGLTRRGYTVKVVGDAIKTLDGSNKIIDEWVETKVVESFTTQQITTILKK